MSDHETSDTESVKASRAAKKVRTAVASGSKSTKRSSSSKSASVASADESPAKKSKHRSSHATAAVEPTADEVDDQSYNEEAARGYGRRPLRR